MSLALITALGVVGVAPLGLPLQIRLSSSRWASHGVFDWLISCSLSKKSVTSPSRAEGGYSPPARR